MVNAFEVLSKSANILREIDRRFIIIIISFFNKNSSFDNKINFASNKHRIA